MKMTAYSIAPQVAWRVIGKQAYIFDPASSELHELSETATVTWLGLEKHDPTTVIAGRISDEFEVGLEQALEDITALLKNLKAKGLIE